LVLFFYINKINSNKILLYYYFSNNKNNVFFFSNIYYLKRSVVFVCVNKVISKKTNDLLIMKAIEKRERERDRKNQVILFPID